MRKELLTDGCAIGRFQIFPFWEDGEDVLMEA
jgi:hypothetical protein